jgi:hypothetical protein
VNKQQQQPVTPPTPGLQYTPNQQVAPLTPQQTQAMQMVSNQAGPTQNFLNNTIGTQDYITSGGLLNPSNPYLSQYFNTLAQPLTEQFAQTTAPNILANAAQTGTIGSAGENQAFGNAETALAQGLGNLGAGLGYSGYNTGVNATETAAANAPSLASGAFVPAQQLAESGQIGQQQAQNVLNTGYNNLYASGESPFQLLNQLGQGLGLASGGTGHGGSVTTNPYSGAGK